jgi:HJR/Mrr/RecB family endonuclease
MGKSRIRFSNEKYLIAKQLAGENGSEDDIVKYYLDPVLAKVIAKYCSKGLFSFLSERSKECTDLLKKFPVIEDYKISLGDFKKASKYLELYRKIGSIIGFSIVLLFWIIYFLDNKPSIVEFLIYLFFAASAMTAVSSYFLNLVFEVLYLNLSKRVRKCVKYCVAIRAYSKNHLEFWHNLSWREFEKEVAILLSNLGVKANATKGTGDKGVDIFATFGRKKIVVQCKKHKSPVGPAIVRELLGTHTVEDANVGIIVSSSGFSPGAQEAASGRILLLGIEDLMQLDKRGFQALLAKYAH